MTKTQIVVTTSIVVVVILFILFNYIIKLNKFTLADGSIIYTKGLNYYTMTGGVEVKIDQTEYNRLKTYIAGQCTNPNGMIQTSSANDTACVYFNYKGHTNDCGDCVPDKPMKKIADKTVYLIKPGAGEWYYSYDPKGSTRDISYVS